MELNKIYNESCIETMSRMPDGFIDLTVTSPPYDNLRTYEDDIDKTWGEHIWKPIIKELYRVTKDGGVVVWVVGDATINGLKTGTSYKQCNYLMSIGFSLIDNIIYKKNSVAFPSKGHRYTNIYENGFVISKGHPCNVNIIKDKKNKWAGHSSYDGKVKEVAKYAPRENIWEYVTSLNDKTEHPAVFPEKLAADHIYSWSNEGDIVYDPFMGSGTTAKMAHIHKRKWIGSEISSKYVELAYKRIDPYLRQTSLF